MGIHEEVLMMVIKAKGSAWVEHHTLLSKPRDYPEAVQRLRRAVHQYIELANPLTQDRLADVAAGAAAETMREVVCHAFEMEIS